MGIDDPIIKDKTPDNEYSTDKDQQWIIYLISYNYTEVPGTSQGIIDGYFSQVHQMYGISSGDSIRAIFIEITKEREKATRFDTKEDADETIEHLKSLEDESTRKHAQTASIQSIPY